MFTVLFVLRPLSWERRCRGEVATFLLFWVWASAQTRKARHRADGIRPTTQPHKTAAQSPSLKRPCWETWRASRVLAMLSVRCGWKYSRAQTRLYSCAWTHIVQQGHLWGAPGQSVILRAHAGFLCPLDRNASRRWWPHLHVTLYL